MAILLVIDDEPNIAFTIGETLASAELQVVTAATARQGLDAVVRRQPDVVLLDVRLPDMSGLDAFRQIHEIDPSVPVIIMTAFATTDNAIEAMRRGAFDYFIKPVDLGSLRAVVQRAIDVHRLNTIPAVLDDEDEEFPDADRIVGRSPAMQEVYKTIGRVAPQDITVLLLGESGTGKELAARAIHHYSRRATRPLLTVNCAALPEALLESELFGHEKGAFTGAEQRHIGKFEQVNGGTIFLDEIGDMSPSTQAKALRLLQQQEFERVGGTETIKTDVRVIAATNKDLAAMVSRGEFRQDLFYRLNGFTLNLPPLRQRTEDIPLLIDYFIRSIGRELSKPIRGMTDEARATLQSHDWPGNVRELHSAIRYAVVHSTGDFITEDQLPQSCRTAALPANSGGEQAESTVTLPGIRRLVAELLERNCTDIYRQVSQVVDQALLEEVLRATSGNQVQAAERLGISRMTLRAKLRGARDPQQSKSAAGE
jgi:two-component system nitrogen regulation response regulator GlnG